MIHSTSVFGLHQIDDDAPLLSDDVSTQWVTASKFRQLAHDWSVKFSAPRTLVFLYIRNSVEGVAQLIGALEAGHTVALLDPNLPDGSKTHLTQSYAPGFICDGSDAPHRDMAGVADLHPDLFVLLS